MKETKKFTEDELHVMHAIQQDPTNSQRVIAKSLGMSLGKVNYCIRSLVEAGFIKLKNFSNSENKIGYMYVLTPQGLSAKILITKRFLEEKQAEYEKLHEYIQESKIN